MKIGSRRVSTASVVVLAIQLVVACSIAGKYLYQRLSCPRVWTRAAAFDPSLPMRGRYLSLQLLVDGCQSTLPSARQAGFPRDVNGAAVQGTYVIQATDYIQFPAELRVSGGKLLAIGIWDGDRGASGQMVTAWPGTPCDQMRLDRAVDFFIPEHAADPTGLKPGQELWIEVTVPPKGPPRPIQLALKQNGAWKPLAYQ
jgi:hypothetical protein